MQPTDFTSWWVQDLEWEFLVIEDEQENAFVVPGGKVVVYTGLLRLLDTEAQLATVLAHEVGHVLARHVVRAGGLGCRV